MSIAAVILTSNEELHVARCIASAKAIADVVLVVDSYSSDDTCTIARSLGARVCQNIWVNYATQFNWALTQLEPNTKWVLRLDADEYLSPGLIGELRRRLPVLDPDIHGVFVRRRMVFQGHMMRHGGTFPIRVLRVFRYGYGRCENRWMDEHIKVAGATVSLEGELIDDNHKSLTWWTEKHNKYASREAVDLLNLRFAFMQHDTIASLTPSDQAGLKRWLKEKVYVRLPAGFRAFAYFAFRYLLQLGFLDRQAGAAFHVLQGFWYRYLVDAKVQEVQRYMTRNEVGVVEAIEKVLDIKIGALSKAEEPHLE